ncbi:MAG TPA: DNA repair protein RecN [Thermodesulfobacteriota bacterium]|nr:DNA repair protein RecN [Thermodesulfobacteriota bacterium]
MLLGLTLRNFTIIDDISVSFGPGLNIITGETGAGKSVIIDALGIILGGKASAGDIKTGKDEAHLEALFEIPSASETAAVLEAAGVDVSGGELLVKRIIPRRGRPRSFINGGIATLRMVEDAASGLVDIFGQHEHQVLLKEENHLRVVDEAGGLADLAAGVKELYRKYRSLESGIAKLSEDEKTLAQREDFLRFQCAEIDDALLREGEDDELEEEKKRLLNSERLLSAAEGAYGKIYESEGSILGALARISSDLGDASRIDPSLSAPAEAVENAVIQLEDAAAGLRDYVSGLEFPEGRLEVVEDRLQEIGTLKRKYGDTIEDILGKRRELGAELGRTANFEEELSRLRAESASVKKELDELARDLSARRKEAASGLVKTVEKELREVGIKSARFSMPFAEKPVSEDGADSAAFMFSANPDEDLKPLVKVASGGELSRIMLVLREAASKSGGGSVVIFDEADSGVGGAVAETVGKKIHALSRRTQVICITHLPQVAKFADSHLAVAKSVEGGKTKVVIQALGREERVKELARMIGGVNITQKTLDAAHEMLGG